MPFRRRWVLPKRTRVPFSLCRASGVALRKANAARTGTSNTAARHGCGFVTYSPGSLFWLSSGVHPVTLRCSLSTVKRPATQLVRRSSRLRLVANMRQSVAPLVFLLTRQPGCAFLVGLMGQHSPEPESREGATPWRKKRKTRRPNPS